MKSNLFKLIPVLYFLLLLSVSARGQSFSKENKIVRSFVLTNDTEIEITNKYGDINLESWDNDSIRIEINYKVTSTKESKLDKTFNAINFDFNANQYYIIAKTVFEGKGSFWTDVSDIANNMFAGGTYTSIDYTIYIPADKRINLTLKYGNVYMANYDGYFKLSLSNGDFKAHNLDGEVELDITFGDATINKIEDGKVKISYGTFSLENSNKLSIIGQSAEFDLGVINNLVIDSKRDKVTIEEIGDISGVTYFSRLVIDDVVYKLDLSTKYGSVKLKEISSKVKKVQLSSYSTTVNMFFRNDYNYFISLTSNDKADVTYSANMGEFKTKTLPGKENIMQAECVIGEKNIAVPVVIDVKSGFVTLKIKD